ncbi:MAG: hypothetical protein M1136_07555 [Chloroflexi bacterium]|nr:hypothetical protein [Chloroflexota bacterium]MCL5075490.1 hypothetical protein [Chloroflexota bacterium]
MPRDKQAKEYKCERCGKVFTSMLRFEHHIAAEHAPMTSKDIRTTRDIPHRPRGKP